MYKFPIGVMTNSFRTDFKTAVEKARKLGVAGVQTYCAKGELAPENVSDETLREMLDIIKSNGLVFSAICGDFGGGFMSRETNPERVEKSKRILDLAKKLECDIVTTHIGIVPSDKKHPRYEIMQEACRSMAEYADEIGSHFAIETGPERPEDLRDFLDSLGSKGVGVNFDPANLVMDFENIDIPEAVYNLKDYIVHTHAKDGVIYKQNDLEVEYGLKPCPEGYNSRDFYEEVPLGKGMVPFKEYLAALENIGYKGFLTVERECGENPEEDIKLAVDFLTAIENN